MPDVGGQVRGVHDVLVPVSAGPSVLGSPTGEESWGVLQGWECDGRNPLKPGYA